MTKIVSKEFDMMEEAEELEAFFAGRVLPTETLQVTCYASVTDAKKFVSSHLMVIKQNRRRPWFSAYLDRLRNFKKFIEKREKKKD